MEYDVTIQRVEYRENTFRVKANSQEEADERATEASWDHDFGTNTVSSSDETAISINKVEG